MSERGKHAAGGTKRTVVDRERHRQLARRVVELVLQDALARVELGLDALALLLVGGDGELARELRLERPEGVAGV